MPAGTRQKHPGEIWGNVLVRQIVLGHGLVALIDDEDEERLSRFSWNAQQANGGLIYARRTGRSDVTIYMHREVLRTQPDELVDHIYFNGLNNRKINLRLATSAQNVWHRRRSGPIGCWLPKLRKWRARIVVSGKTIDIGRLDTQEEAARAYDILSEALRGDFAHLNGIETAIDNLAFAPTARRLLFKLRSDSR